MIAPGIRAVETLGLSKSYVKGKAPVAVFGGLEIKIEAGEFVAILGPSGSGKSTLLNLIAGFDRPSGGVLRVAGTELNTLTDRELARWRLNTLGFVFQAFNLITSLTAFENVEVPLRNLGLPKDQRRANVTKALDLVDIGSRASHYPHELSGGEEQRVAIARAIVTDADIIVADEPTGNLDSNSATRVLEILKALNGQGKTIILVTHDAHAASYATRRIEMQKA